MVMAYEGRECSCVHKTVQLKCCREWLEGFSQVLEYDYYSMSFEQITD